MTTPVPSHTFQVSVHLHASEVKIRPHLIEQGLVCHWKQRMNREQRPESRSFTFAMYREDPKTHRQIALYTSIEETRQWTSSPLIFQGLFEGSNETDVFYQAICAFWEDIFSSSGMFRTEREIALLTNWQWAKYWSMGGLPRGLYAHSEAVDLSRDLCLPGFNDQMAKE